MWLCSTAQRPISNSHLILFHSRKASFVFLILFYPNLHSAKLLQFPMKHFSGLSSFILLQKIPGRKRDHHVSAWHEIRLYQTQVRLLPSLFCLDLNDVTKSLIVTDYGWQRYSSFWISYRHTGIDAAADLCKNHHLVALFANLALGEMQNMQNVFHFKVSVPTTYVSLIPN